MTATQFLDSTSVFFKTIFINFLNHLPNLLFAILVFFGFLIISKMLAKAFNHRIDGKVEDPLLVRFLIKATKWIFIITGFIISLKILNLDGAASSLLAGAGITAFVIGFAFKDIGENLLSGLLLAFNRPFRDGDCIEVNGVEGVVKNLNLRNTHIKSSDGKDVFVPNSKIIKDVLYNRTMDGLLRYEFTISVPYGDNFIQKTDSVLNILENHPAVYKGNKPKMFPNKIIGNNIEVTVGYWVNVDDKNFNHSNVRFQLIEECLKSINGADK